MIDRFESCVWCVGCGCVLGEALRKIPTKALQKMPDQLKVTSVTFSSKTKEGGEKNSRGICWTF